jgi:hypothetical protein
MSERIKRLPRDPRGFPIPWFVYRDVTGAADFRIISPGKIQLAVRRDLCWVCGGKMSSRKCFVIGPMCTLNHISAEPPMHKACAIFSATNCPFLTEPRMRRNEKNLPADGYTLEGAKMHNPGAVAVWVTDTFTLMPVDNGVLFKMGEPEYVRWYTGAKLATRAEVTRAIEKGLPILIDAAQRDGDDAVLDLMASVKKARAYMPTGDESDAELDDEAGPHQLDADAAVAAHEPGGKTHREERAAAARSADAQEDEPARD